MSDKENLADNTEDMNMKDENTTDIIAKAVVIIEKKEAIGETSRAVEREKKRKPEGESSGLNSTLVEVNIISDSSTPTPKRKLKTAEKQARRERAYERRKQRRLLFKNRSSDSSDETSPKTKKISKFNLQEDEYFERVDATDGEADFNPSRVRWRSKKDALKRVQDIEDSETSQSSTLRSSESMFSDHNDTLPVESVETSVSADTFKSQPSTSAAVPSTSAAEPSSSATIPLSPPVLLPLAPVLLPLAPVIPPPAPGRSAAIYDVFELINEEFFKDRPYGHASAPDRLECMRETPHHALPTTRKLRRRSI